MATPTNTPVPTPVVSEATDQPKTPIDLWLVRQQMEAELRPVMRKEFQELFQFWKDNELAELDKKYNITIQEELPKLFKEWAEAQKPPTEQELQKVLNQEYVTFTLDIEEVKEFEDERDPEIVKRHFVIRELPATIEKRFYGTIKQRLLTKSSEIQSLVQANMEIPFEEKMKRTLNLFEDAFEILAESTVMCLNPFGKKAYVTKEWVQDHLSLDRQWRIIETQIQVNRLRDFFSKISQSGQMMTTTLNGVNIQLLQQRHQ